MKKLLTITLTFSMFLLATLLVSCNNFKQPTTEVVPLTLENWEEYLTCQESSNTTPVTQTTLFGFPVYESTGTYTIKFYSKTNVSYENVNITIQLEIASYAYPSSSPLTLKERTPDDWKFTNNSTVGSLSGKTYWRITKNCVLSNTGEFSFSEPCKMYYLKSSPFGSYKSLETAVNFTITEISGNVVVTLNS